MSLIKAGEQAPDFKFVDTDNNVVTLADFKGVKVLLSFHPLAFTSVCTDQMRALERNYDKITEKGVDAVLGVSVDAVPTKAVWKKALGIDDVVFVSDFEPKGESSKKLGTWAEELGTSGRCAILIDDGKVVWSKEYELGELPCVKEMLEEI